MQATPHKQITANKSTAQKNTAHRLAVTYLVIASAYEDHAERQSSEGDLSDVSSFCVSSHRDKDLHKFLSLGS